MNELTGNGAITDEYFAEVERKKPEIERLTRNAALARKAQEDKIRALINSQKPAS